MGESSSEARVAIDRGAQSQVEGSNPSSPALYWTEGVSLRDAEMAVFLQALKLYKGNRNAVARSLKICIRTVRNKINLYRQMGHWID